jgi:ubiquinone/menaquinone biosynthesis C-methylase UbiE
MKEDPYRSIAAWYDRLFEPINKRLRVLGLRLFLPKKGMAVLDVGCGTGLLLDLYRKYQCALYGIDPSPSMLEIARRRLGDEAKLHLGDASDMPYENGSFDLAVAMLVLHEMNGATRSSVMREMKRVLKPGGRMLLIDFHPGPIRPLQWWTTKLMITVSEIAAGSEHFRNYRQFLKVKGLPALISEHGLVIKKRRIVSGGALAAFLLSPE